MVKSMPRAHIAIEWVDSLLFLENNFDRLR